MFCNHTLLSLGLFCEIDDHVFLTNFVNLSNWLYAINPQIHPNRLNIANTNSIKSYPYLKKNLKLKEFQKNRGYHGNK